MFAVVELLGLQTASLLQKAGCTGVQLSNRLTLVDSVTVHFVWQVHGNCTENRKFLSVFTVYMRGKPLPEGILNHLSCLISMWMRLYSEYLLIFWSLSRARDHR